MGNLWRVVAIVVLVGCGGSDGPDIEPERACEDIADAFGRLCERCLGAGAYLECRDQVRDAVGGCANVVQIRDLEEVYTRCIPWANTVDCAQVTATGFALDSSCDGQLLVP